MGEAAEQREVVAAGFSPQRSCRARSHREIPHPYTPGLPELPAPPAEFWGVMGFGHCQGEPRFGKHGKYPCWKGKAESHVVIERPELVSS